MSSITLKEKEKIMASLHEKISLKIQAITQEHPNLEYEVVSEAKKRAHKKHNLPSKKKMFEKALQKLWKAKEEAEDIYCELMAQVVGKTKEDVRESVTRYNSGGHISLSSLSEFSSQVDDAAEGDLQFYISQVMNESPVGRQVQALREQKKYVDDAVMLATTSARLYPIYERVMTAIGATETPLIEAALNSNGRAPALPSGK